MGKIKIVFILGTLDIGGTEKQFIETIRRLNRDRFELRVLAFPCQGKVRTEIEALHIPFACLDFSGLKGKFRPESYLRFYRLIRDMVRYFRQEKPHIVQSYLFWANIYGCIAAKIAGVTIIITGRREFMPKRHQRFPNQWLQNLSNLWATVIIANSQTLKQQCKKQEKYITEEKIQVIYNGVDLSRYSLNSPKRSLKKALNIPDNSYVVGMVANLRPVKGSQDFLKAGALVLRTFPHTVFLLVGRHEDMTLELITLAADLGIQDALRFTGERDDIPELLSIFDVQVSSSLEEGLSNAILEGMAMGKPIIATYVGGNPELVIHERTGLLVPPGNPDRLAEAILRILGDQALRTQLGNAGRQRIVTSFRVEEMVHQLEGLYQKLAIAGKLS
jgi:glycosyltransferase involved in cell wall biosynthesis